MTRDQAQVGAHVSCRHTEGTGVVLACPADNTDRVFVAWRSGGVRFAQHLPLVSLQLLEEARR